MRQEGNIKDWQENISDLHPFYLFSGSNKHTKYNARMEIRINKRSLNMRISSISVIFLQIVCVPGNCFPTRK